MSEIYHSPCFPPGAGPDFANAVFAIETGAPAKDVLALLHSVEAEFGRERVARWGQRTLDLDLIACADAIAPDKETLRTWMNMPLSEQKTRTPQELVLPHPRIQDRAFVLVPLMDIAPDWVHPLTGHSVRQMRDALPKADRDSVKPLVNREKQT